MSSQRLGEVFEGDSADMCAGKFLLMLMGGRAEGLPCPDPGAIFNNPSAHFVNQMYPLVVRTTVRMDKG